MNHECFQVVMKKTSLCEFYFFNKLPFLDICLTGKLLISSYQRLGVFLIQFNSGKLISSSLSISYLSARIMTLLFFDDEHMKSLLTSSKMCQLIKGNINFQFIIILGNLFISAEIDLYIQ